jgi:hypothetical protein
MKQCAFQLALLLAASAIALAQPSQPPPKRFPAEKITPEQLEIYKSEVQAIPDIQCQEIGAYQRQCTSSAQFTIWIFTLPGHLAHPAVTQAVMLVQRDGQGARVGINRSGYYAGDSGAFDKWMKGFRVIDQKQVAQWENTLQPK